MNVELSAVNVCLCIGAGVGAGGRGCGGGEGDGGGKGVAWRYPKVSRSAPVAEMPPAEDCNKAGTTTETQREDSLRPERWSPLPGIGTIDYFPSID